MKNDFDWDLTMAIDSVHLIHARISAETLYQAIKQRLLDEVEGKLTIRNAWKSGVELVNKDG